MVARRHWQGVFSFSFSFSFSSLCCLFVLFLCHAQILINKKKKHGTETMRENIYWNIFTLICFCVLIFLDRHPLGHLCTAHRWFQQKTHTYIAISVLHDYVCCSLLTLLLFVLSLSLSMSVCVCVCVSLHVLLFFHQIYFKKKK